MHSRQILTGQLDCVLFLFHEQQPLVAKNLIPTHAVLFPLP